jgi:hypothetical protein
LPHLIWLEGCDSGEDAVVANAVTSVELMNVRNSLRMWRELQKYRIEEESLYELVARDIVGQVLIIRSVGFDVQNLKGNALNALCLLTTEEVKGIMLRAEDDKIAQVAVAYIEAIEGDFLRYFRSIQERNLGSGCSLAPGEPHF